MDKAQIDKFFNDTASPEEAEQVLEWFDTLEGQRYLNQRLNDDIHQIYRKNSSTETANQAFQQLILQIDPQKRSPLYSLSSFNTKSSWVLTVVLLLAAGLSTFIGYTLLTEPESAKSNLVQTSVYSTSKGEQRTIALSDGSQLRLNESSWVEIPAYFAPDIRSIQFAGEVFFEVAADSTRPFVVTTGKTRVRVLGTSFVIKSDSNSQNATIAVASGKVSLGITVPGAPPPLILEKNMIGRVNPSEGTVHSEQTEVHNYLSWINGRIVFNSNPFPAVARQLSHIYNMDFELLDDDLQELRLTADISAGPAEEVFETIAQSLGIQFSIQDNTVHWKHSPKEN